MAIRGASLSDEPDLTPLPKISLHTLPLFFRQSITSKRFLRDNSDDKGVFMRRFQFRLESVLHHRVLIAEQKEQEYIKAQNYVLELEKALVRLQQTHEAVVQGRDDTCSESRFDVDAISNRERYLVTLAYRIGSAERELEAARIVMEETRVEMVKANQEREAVTKLREKAHAEYVAEQQKQEQDMLDDMASLRYKQSQKVA